MWIDAGRHLSGAWRNGPPTTTAVGREAPFWPSAALPGEQTSRVIYARPRNANRSYLSALVASVTYLILAASEL